MGQLVKMLRRVAPGLTRGPSPVLSARGRGPIMTRTSRHVEQAVVDDGVGGGPRVEPGATRGLMGVLVAPLLLLALAACGFSPLYATTDEGIRSEMRGVTVGQVTGPPDAAYFAEDALRDVLPGRGQATYTLDVQLRDQRRAVAVTRAANTTRFDYVLNARYALRDVETGEVRRNTISTTVSYGVVESQYASLVGAEDAVRRAAVDLARRVETDVALYLKGRAPDETSVDVSPVLDDPRDRGGLNDFDEDDFDGDEPGDGDTPGLNAPPEAEAVDGPARAGR